MSFFNLIIADPTGLCFGVRRAIESLERTLKDNKKVYSLGSPIHNPQEVQRLKDMGLEVVESPEDVPEGAVAFIRAHGVVPQAHAALSVRCKSVVDGTCPFVRTAQDKAGELSREGYPVIILGDRYHPEVQGILGYIEGKAYVLASADEFDGAVAGAKKFGVLSQTTQKESSFSQLVGKIVSVTPETKVYNTICKATLDRQNSVRLLASSVDGILIIGGKNSANTKKMAEIAQSEQAPTLWIEHAGELDMEWLEGKESLGLAAGGSTPDWLIKEVTEKLQHLRAL